MQHLSFKSYKNINILDKDCNIFTAIFHSIRYIPWYQKCVDEKYHPLDYLLKECPKVEYVCDPWYYKIQEIGK